MSALLQALKVCLGDVNTQGLHLCLQPRKSPFSVLFPILVRTAEVRAKESL